MMLRFSPTVLVGRLIALAFVVAITAPIATCSPPVSILDQIQATGFLRVATVNSPTTYYSGPLGDEGFEYDLFKGFADHLGVALDLQVLDSVAAVLDAVATGRAHIGAAGLGVTDNRKAQVRFSRPTRTVVPQLVYRMREHKPKSLDDLANGRLVVVAGSAVSERLEALQADYPGLHWEESAQFESEDLLVQVIEGQINYTIANSDLVSINQRYYPFLRVAFDLEDPQHLAWALPLDGALLDQAVNDYLDSVGDIELARMRDRYFGHIDKVGYFGAVTLATHAETRLPKYRADFEKAAEAHGLDWRVLAAVGYQESHWQVDAVSMTGVRGLMQITEETADFLGIDDRLDPKQAIEGAARYLKHLKDALPPEIQEPDRSWMMLASYNQGLGHLNDARIVTARNGGDPNRWPDVRANLPLLMQPKVYRTLKHGYARGSEAVTYVGNIRTYYDMLVWITGGTRLAETAEPGDDAEPVTAEPPTLERERFDPLDIDTPIL